MKEIIFSEDELQNLDQVAEKLFIRSEKDNPSSICYDRHLERPKISWIRIFLHIFIPLAISAGITIALQCGGMDPAISMLISSFLLLCYLLRSLKKMLICCIRIYQRFAPSSIRMKCRFEPSCSQYMILSLKKYGVLKGLKIGIDRLKRCKVGNGGYDFP